MQRSLAKDKVILGLSGGVDSTAAALLLQKKGLEVIGLYFDIAKEKSETSVQAEQAADQLGIQFVYRNVHDRFEASVIENFCAEYVKGRTPNPCVVCNPTVKFHTLLDEADKQGAYYIATGHYARIGQLEPFGYRIRKAENEKKDQSYMLYRLDESVLSRLLLPLGTAEDKEAMRQLARSNHLFNADQKDSQEICFIEKDSNYVTYMMERGHRTPKGNFIDQSGKILGQHKGFIHYTIGQRKGLGITFGKPMFVTAMDAASNTITLGSNEDLFTDRVLSLQNVFPIHMPETLPVQAKIRYAAKPADATIQLRSDGSVLTVFKEKQRAITPGQSIVFYFNDYVIGGGIIESIDDKIIM